MPGAARGAASCDIAVIRQKHISPSAFITLDYTEASCYENALCPGLLFLLGACLSAEEVTVTVLATTDLHGNLYPYDYYAGKPADRGLAKIATLIRRERQDSPNNILIDCGDTIQGTPLEYVYQHWQETGRLPLDLSFAGAPLTADPMMLAMNALGYDAMVAGNHDFNFGLKNQMAARRLAHFPWISANTKTVAGAGVPPFAPWVVKTVAGVKVAIVGITTPGIPQWDPPEHYKGYRFEGGARCN